MTIPNIATFDHGTDVASDYSGIFAFFAGQCFSSSFASWRFQLSPAALRPQENGNTSSYILQELLISMETQYNKGTVLLIDENCFGFAYV